MYLLLSFYAKLSLGICALDICKSLSCLMSVWRYSKMDADISHHADQKKCLVCKHFKFIAAN